MKQLVPVFCTSLLVFACSSDDGGGTKSDSEYERDVTSGMHAALLTDVDALHDAALAIQAAAPAPAGRGWDATQDATALAALKDAWLDARKAYERTEGALAPLFTDIDAAIDARYEDFLEEGPDDDLFDGEGVTGMHAIERILFVDTTPATVVAVEASLPGYEAAAWPATAAEAAEFKNGLCARLVDDTEELKEAWKPAVIDLEGAFGGLISLMNEQREKVNKAASEEEESRYAQRTLADLRENLAGSKSIYEIFRPWILSKENGADIDADIQASFQSLQSTYFGVQGDAIPQPSDTWSSESPSAADLQTPFGRLYTAVQEAVDPNRPGSAVDGMNRAAAELGFEEFVEE
jgi:iron uptake system component EfeO